jgi:hypothetical protein
MGDVGGKGLTGSALRICDAPAGARGVRAPALGAPVPAPPIPGSGQRDIPACGALAVALCPPHPPRPHVSALLPGLEPIGQVLDAREDDPSGRIPRLTKGMSVADLAYALAAISEEHSYDLV